MIKRILSTVAASILLLTGSAQAKTYQPQVVWHNAGTGELSAWLLTANGTVTGKQALSWPCDRASGCSSEWKTVGTGDFNADGVSDLLWHNAGTGELSAWLLAANGTVNGKQALSWKCGPDCTQDWKPIGVGDFNGDGTSDVLWHNVGTGELSAWLLAANGTVNGKQALSWKCGSDCTQDWKPIGVGDLNGDGISDVLWHNAGTGEVSTWLLTANGTVTGKQALSWQCNKASGCSREWKPVGIADFNGDGKNDLLWQNTGSGVLSAWLLTGNGTVTGKQDLSWQCNKASKCSREWKVVGTSS
jgi:FG-GAP-like repeat